MVSAVQEVLPATPMNSFAAARVLRNVSPAEQLLKPRSFVLRNAILSKLWIVPIALLLFPLWLPLGVKFRRREPVGLSRDELSLLVAMPTAVDKLPVETGTVKATRGQLTITPITQPQKQIETPTLPEAPIQPIQSEEDRSTP